MYRKTNREDVLLATSSRFVFILLILRPIPIRCFTFLHLSLMPRT